jgi:hypothetical protein
LEDPKKAFYDLGIKALIDYILMQIPCKNKDFLTFSSKHSIINNSRVGKQRTAMERGGTLPLRTMASQKITCSGEAEGLLSILADGT